MRWFEHMPDYRAGLIEKGMEIMTAGNSAKAVGKIPHYHIKKSFNSQVLKEKKRCIRKIVFNTSCQNEENLSIANRQLSSNERQPSQIDVL